MPLERMIDQAHSPRVVEYTDEAALLAALPTDAQDMHLPVVIVGGGACGLSAALFLSDLGVPSLVLERDDVPSGSSALSSGFVPAAGTAAQKVQGLEDTPRAFAQDIQDKAKGLAAPHLVAAYTQAIAKALDALGQNHGFEWSVLDHFLYPGHQQYRMHTLPSRTGQALMDQLQRACQNKDIPVLTQSRVLELWVIKETKRVGAVGYRRPNGQMEFVRPRKR
jgi:fumarate reductase flavoprotein subunit